MGLAYKADRVTRDVDAIFKPAAELRKIIAEVAVKNDLDEDWLNDGAKGFMPGTDVDAVAFYESDNLSVYVASKPYLLAMKLHAGRDQRNRDDAILLARLLGYTSYEQLSDLLVKYFGGRLQPKHRYLALEIASELSAGNNSAAQAKQGMGTEA